MLKTRREKYINLVDEGSISIFFSGRAMHKSNDQYFPFSVNRNFFYLTNIEQEDVILVVVKGREKTDSFLFIEKVDPIKALWDGATLSFEEASQLSNIEISNIKDIISFDTFINQLLGLSRAASFGSINTVYFDLEKPRFTDYLTETEFKANKFKKLYPAINIENSYKHLTRLRMVKDELEVNETIKAIEITNKALNHLMNSLKPGVNEFEIEAEYNYILNKNNVEPSFNTIAASGKNATILHYVDNNEVINDNELLLLDLGVKYNNYCSDISRTYPANGKFSERQKAVYEVVLEANKKTIEWLKPGRTIKEFNDFGKNILAKGLKELGLITDDSEVTKYYYHSLGHYLGLDIHDVGLYDEVIPEGAIITVEPGLYIAEENIGIRIEDNILITKDGNINLSKDLIKEIKDIENFMK